MEEWTCKTGADGYFARSPSLKAKGLSQYVPGCGMRHETYLVGTVNGVEIHAHYIGLGAAESDVEVWRTTWCGRRWAKVTLLYAIFRPHLKRAIKQTDAVHDETVV